MSNDSLWTKHGCGIVCYMPHGGTSFERPAPGCSMRLSEPVTDWILTVDDCGRELRRVAVSSVREIVWVIEPAPVPKPVERFTEQQVAFWRSLGGEFGVDGTPADITGATLEQACRWWLAGGEAKHEEHVEWMRRDGIGVVFNRERKGIVCWDCVIEDCLSNRWILKADAAVLEKYHG